MLEFQKSVILYKCGLGLTKQSHMKSRLQHENLVYGRQTGCRAGVEGCMVECRDDLVGVSGRSEGDSLSARRMNCSAVKGEPGDDLREWGLCPLGVDNENAG